MALDLFNGVNISTYGASVSSKFFQPANMNQSTQWEKSQLSPRTLGTYTTFKYFEIRLLFQGQTRDIIYQNISNFYANIETEFKVQFRNLSHTYHCFLSGTPALEETQINRWVYVTLSGNCLELGAETNTTLRLVSGGTEYYCDITNSGNMTTPCKLTMTLSASYTSLTIRGLTEDLITIKAVANKDVLVIDGITGKITKNGVNYFSEVDLFNLPRLNKGTTRLYFSNSQHTSIITYTPRFV